MKRLIEFHFALLWLMVLVPESSADGPRDNNPLTVRRVPKLGVELDAATHEELSESLVKLEGRIKVLSQLKRISEQDLDDIRVLSRAVQIAIEHQEFFSLKDVPKARRLVTQALWQAEQLEADRRPWQEQPGLKVRGFRSRLDGSLQPYGLVLPPGFDPHRPGGYRLDIWLHGRGETLSELNFLDQRLRQTGRIAPRDTIVLHPYGRYSNAFKFAGEVDVFEALQHVQNHYPIDTDRIAMRGFSMGGAGCWQFAVHFPDRFFATTPGAGFSETPEFLKSFQKETLQPLWYETKLWQMYDCPVYAANLTNLPTIAYSGENDIQKQAADVMEAALSDNGIDLVHLIGPETGHTIHPDSLDEIESRLEHIARVGRDRVPKRVRFATATLQYHRSFWVSLEGLGEHWEPASIDATVDEHIGIRATTQNVTAVAFQFAAGESPFPVTGPVRLEIDGQELAGPRPRSDRSFHVRLSRHAGRWSIVTEPPSGLRKRPGLHGPIDHAFMNSFVFVVPSEKSQISDAVEDWSDSERHRAIEHWRRHFRGEAIVIDDKDVDDAQIANSNLVLWGDPTNNAVLARIRDRLPIRWDQNRIEVGETKFSAQDHALVMVYPNPLNPDRYIVLNSGFTYREYAYLNNARQVPMLPDWAVIDLKVAPGTQYPGRIPAAGFFDESWNLKAKIDQ